MIRSSEQVGPALGHKDIELSSLIQNTEEKVDSVPEQCQTDQTSVVLREKTQNGSDVVIKDQLLSHSLWFQLD